MTSTNYSDRLYAARDMAAGKNFWYRFRTALILWQLRRHAPRLSSFLEVGCGAGLVISAVGKAFPEARLAACEEQPEGVRRARHNLPSDAEVFQGDACQLQPSASYDVVGAFDVVEHIENDQAALAAMAGALKPGGLIVLTVPQHQFLWSKKDEVSGHKRRYEPGQLEDRVRAAKLHIVDSMPFMTMLLPVMYLKTRLQQKDGQSAAENDMAVPAFFNAVFYFVCQFERFLLAAGLRLSWGGSRLVVARKDDVLDMTEAG